MTSKSRRWIGLGVRCGIIAAAAVWLARVLEWDELKRVVASADGRMALLSLLAFGPSTFLISIRLKWLLAVHDVRLSVWEAVKVTFMGNFMINALPVGTSGGDAVKAFYVARDTPHKHEAVTTVFFDRVVGLIGLIGMSGVVVLFNWGNPAFARWGRIIGLLVVAVFAGAGVYFSRRMRGMLRLDAIVARLPLSGHFQRVDRALFGFRRRWRRIAAAMAITVLLQFVAIVSVFLGGQAFGIKGPEALPTLLVYLGYTPICYLAGGLPIGVMEATFIQLFVHQAGFGTQEAAVSLSLFGRLVQLVWALPGGIVFLKGRREPMGEEWESEKVGKWESGEEGGMGGANHTSEM